MKLSQIHRKILLTIAIIFLLICIAWFITQTIPAKNKATISELPIHTDSLTSLADSNTVYFYNGIGIFTYNPTNHTVQTIASTSTLPTISQLWHIDENNFLVRLDNAIDGTLILEYYDKNNIDYDTEASQFLWLLSTKDGIISPSIASKAFSPQVKPLITNDFIYIADNGPFNSTVELTNIIQISRKNLNNKASPLNIDSSYIKAIFKCGQSPCIITRSNTENTETAWQLNESLEKKKLFSAHSINPYNLPQSVSITEKDQQSKDDSTLTYIDEPLRPIHIRSLSDNNEKKLSNHTVGASVHLLFGTKQNYISQNDTDSLTITGSVITGQQKEYEDTENAISKNKDTIISVDYLPEISLARGAKNNYLITSRYSTIKKSPEVNQDAYKECVADAVYNELDNTLASIYFTTNTTHSSTVVDCLSKNSPEAIINYHFTTHILNENGRIVR